MKKTYMNPVVDINMLTLGQVLCASAAGPDAQIGINSEVTLGEGSII